MQRHRHQQALAAIMLHQRRHVARHRPRDSDLATVLQTNGEAAGDVVIGDRGAGPRNARRAGKADPALLGLGRLQRQATRGAAAVAQELHLLPAIGAEAVDVRNDDSAGGAARRKCEIQNLTGKRSNSAE